MAADGARNVDVELHIWIKNRNADGLELQNETKLTTQYRDSIAVDCLHPCFPPLSDATLPVLITIIGTAGWCRDVFLHVGLCLSVVVFEVTERHLLVFISGTSGLSQRSLSVQRFKLILEIGRRKGERRGAHSHTRDNRNCS